MRQRRVATVVGCAILGLVAGFVIHHLISETRVVTAIHLAVVGLVGGAVLGLALASVARPRLWHGLLWAIPASMVAVIPSIAIRASAGDLPFAVMAIDHVELIALPLYIVYGFLGPSITELARRIAPASAASASTGG
jgi:hypothetical protein